MALPQEVDHWSLITLREKLIKIGAKVARHGCYITFQLAEVAIPRSLAETPALGRQLLDALAQARLLLTACAILPGRKVEVGQQPSVGSDFGTVELKLQPTVKIAPQNPRFRFTHRVSHINTPNPPIT